MKIIVALLALVALAHADTVAPNAVEIRLEGSGTTVGNYQFSASNGQLCVSFNLDQPNYRVVEFQLHVGSSATDAPLAIDGITYAFAFFEHENQYCCAPATSGEQCVAYTGCDLDYYVFAHLWVVEVDASGVPIAEPVSAHISDGGAQHIYISCPGGTYENKNGCETAWAGPAPDSANPTNFADMASESFYDIVGWTRWGWNLCFYKTGSYVVYIYAGAGRSDLSKGHHVGNAFVDLTCDPTGSCTVSFTAVAYSQCSDGDNNIFESFHLGVSQNSVLGTEFIVFPPTVPPGQLQYKQTFSSPQSSVTATRSVGCDFNAFQPDLACPAQYLYQLVNPENGHAPVCIQAHIDVCHACTLAGVQYTNV